MLRVSRHFSSESNFSLRCDLLCFALLRSLLSTNVEYQMSNQLQRLSIQTRKLRGMIKTMHAIKWFKSGAGDRYSVRWQISEFLSAA